MFRELFAATASAALIAGAAIAPAAAQDMPQYTQGAETDPAATTDASAYVGASVYDSAGQEVGVIDEIVTGADGSEQAVLSVGEFLGIGSKKITVPTAELTAKDDGKGYSVSLTSEEIESAPAYEADASEPM